MTLESLPSSSSSALDHNHNEKNHPIYYFPDGTLIIDVETHRFRVHHALVVRHSRYLSSLSSLAVGDETELKLKHVRIEPEKKVRVEDIEALLRHLYHDVHLETPSTPLTLPHTISLLRITSPAQLDLPHLHQLSLNVFEKAFRVNPEEEVRHWDAGVLYAALPVAKEFRVREAMKAIYYSLVATTEFEMGEETEGSTAPDTPSAPTALSPSTPTLSLSHQDAQTCQILMTSLINHFTPILFTPPAASHMECTDVFAGTWMGLVIQPAISGEGSGEGEGDSGEGEAEAEGDGDGDGGENNGDGSETGTGTGIGKDTRKDIRKPSGMGVYKPLETLQLIRALDWERVGVCASCVREKREEWGREGWGVWRGVAGWIGLDEEEEGVGA